MSSYVVLARKWRPQRFEDLTGQGHVAQTLTNAIEKERVPHALLFTGARGVGKTSSARILAMALNCAEGPTPNPCGVCSACTEIQKSQSVDVLEIDGASNRGINEIRELRDGVRYAPNRDRYKIYIIDEVHMLTTEAFNALLKTLEEPPKHVIFIFATTEAQKIPVTILSRCQRFDFRRIPHAEIVERLTYIAGQEDLRIDPEVLGIVARQAAGGMRDAFSILDQVIAFAGNDISLSDAESILGAAERRRLFELSAALIKRDVEAALTVVDDVDAFGVDLTHFSMELVAHLRDLAIVAVSKDPAALTAMTDGELADAREQVTHTEVSTLHHMFEIMVESTEAIARSNHPRLLLEMALVRLAAIEPVLPIMRLIERLEALAAGETLPPAPSGGGASGGTPSGGGAQPTPATTQAASAQPAPVQAAPAEPAPEVAAPAEVTPTEPKPASTPAEPAPVQAAPAEAAPVEVPAEPEPAPAAAPIAEATSVDTPVQTTPVEAAPVEPTPVEAAPVEPTPVEAEPIIALPALGLEASAIAEASALHSQLTAVADQLPHVLTEDAWTSMVRTLRVELPPAGELMAVAHARVEEGSVTLALPDALLDKVDADLLARLGALSSELAGAKLDFRAVSENKVPAQSPGPSYHVAGRELEAREAREAAAHAYVREHAATALLMKRFPGSEIARIHVHETPTEEIL